MNGCFSHCTARGLAIVAGLALAAAPASAESIAPGKVVPLDGGTLTENRQSNGEVEFSGAYPTWMVEHPAIMVDNGVPVGFEAGLLPAVEIDDADRTFLSIACQDWVFASLFFLGDGIQFGPNQITPRTLCDNFVPGLPESFLGAGDETPLGTVMEINGFSATLYLIDVCTTDGDGDGADDVLFNAVDVNPTADGDQWWGRWTVRYFRETSGDNNPTNPQNMVTGDADELIIHLDTGTNDGSIPGVPADFGGLTATSFPDQLGLAPDFFGTGITRPAIVELTHAPVDAIAGDCYWAEMYVQFDETQVVESSACMIPVWPSSQVGGDGWCWYNSGGGNQFFPGDEVGPQGDRNWCLDIDEPFDVDNDPLTPDELIDSGVNFAAIGPCSNDPCLGASPFNDECGDSILLTLVEDGINPDLNGAPSRSIISNAADSDTECAVPLPDGVHRGSTLEFEQSIFFRVIGDGTVYTVSTCVEGNSPDEEASGGPRRNWTLDILCGPTCDNAYFLGQVRASDDLTGVGCTGPGSCALDFGRPGYSWPEASFATTAGQTYYIAVSHVFTPGICRIRISSDNVQTTADLTEQCDVCTNDINQFGAAPTVIEVEDENTPGGCITYADGALDFENSRTNNGCQFVPEDPILSAAYIPTFDFLNGVDNSPISGPTSFVVAGRGSYTTVDPGRDFPDQDNYSFTVAAPTFVRFSSNGNIGNSALITQYGAPDAVTGVASAGACDVADDATDVAGSTGCDATPDNESSVLMPGVLYALQAQIADGVDIDCLSVERDYLFFIEFLSCPEVADLSGSADVVDSDLTVGANNPLNFDTDTDMDMVNDAHGFAGCNVLVDANAGCDRVFTEGEIYSTDSLGLGQLFFGDLGNDGNNTDTDWIEFVAPASGEVTIDIDANYDFFLQIYEFPIADCIDTSVTTPSTTCEFVASFAPGVTLDEMGNCQFSDPISLSGLTPGTSYGIQLTHGNIGIASFVFDGRACDSGYNHYTVQIDEVVSSDPVSCVGGFGGEYTVCQNVSAADCSANNGVVQPDLCENLASICIADQTTTNTNPGDAGYAAADGTVDGADLSYFVEQWLGSTGRADLTTTNTNPGDAGYGFQDSTVDGADLSFFVELWIDASAGVDCINS